MYDPTIFDNLKVAFENQVYDLDNLENEITITNRLDRMDFSVMGREFAIEFTLVDLPDVTAEIVLEASLENLSSEILELPGKNPGCSLLLRFYKRVHNVTKQCKEIEQCLKEIWESDQKLTQTLSFMYEQEASNYLDTIEVPFNSINEDHMGDIEEFLDHVIESLEVLNEI
jgi:hypothetical protein